jgi:hypothetical protein
LSGPACGPRFQAINGCLQKLGPQLVKTLLADVQPAAGFLHTVIASHRLQDHLQALLGLLRAW